MTGQQLIHHQIYNCLSLFMVSIFTQAIYNNIVAENMITTLLKHQIHDFQGMINMPVLARTINKHIECDLNKFKTICNLLLYIAESIFYSPQLAVQYPLIKILTVKLVGEHPISNISFHPPRCYPL